MPAPDPVDPMETVLREDPLHASARAMAAYVERLRATGRDHHANAIEASRGRC